MNNRGSSENVVSFHSTPSAPSTPPSSPRRPPLPRRVRLRRRIWLVLMLILFLWSGSEWIIQTRAVHSKEAALVEKRRELASLEKERRELKQEINRLQDEDYLFELARKMGYGKPGEEILDVSDLP
ncbi:septum formation initiator family protein [Kroppenstedtia eburnea]|uniref:FtsB family cell division protein n=1 Tax=Kroppenstedtia eburnea TaxID=714067 RepID=UPI00363C0C79